MHIFIGIISIVVSLFLIIKTQWFIENFGTSAWAEANLGTSGGTRLMLKFIGLILIFFGFLAITNMWEGFLMGTVGKIFIR